VAGEAGPVIRGEGCECAGLDSKLSIRRRFFVRIREIERSPTEKRT
jgi:hypothetical protein